MTSSTELNGENRDSYMHLVQDSRSVNMLFKNYAPSPVLEEANRAIGSI